MTGTHASVAFGMSHDSEHLYDHPLSSFSPCVAVLVLHVDVGLP